VRYPDREPRKISSVNVGKFIDHEAVPQEDGRIAVFKFTRLTKNSLGNMRRCL
jgi:hypothetical protein